MKNTPFEFSKFSSGILILFTFCLTLGCSDSGSSPAEERIVNDDFAYASWPNETTSSPESGQIKSKVLISDLNKDGTKENIFISVLPNSSNQKSSILRITTGTDFIEASNFKSTNIHLYQPSIPYSFDLDKDGNKELLFLSYDLDRVYSFELKNKLKDVFVRWSAKLPQALDEGFDLKFSPVTFQDKEMIKIGQYGLFEKSNKKVKVFDLAGGGSGDDDD